MKKNVIKPVLVQKTFSNISKTYDTWSKTLRDLTKVQTCTILDWLQMGKTFFNIKEIINMLEIWYGIVIRKNFNNGILVVCDPINLSLPYSNDDLKKILTWASFYKESKPILITKKLNEWEEIVSFFALQTKNLNKSKTPQISTNWNKYYNYLSGSCL